MIHPCSFMKFSTFSLLKTQAAPLIDAAANNVALAADRRSSPPPTVGLHLFAAKGARAKQNNRAEEVAEAPETVALLPKASICLDMLAQDLKDNLLAVLRALELLLDGSLDKNITANVRRFGSSLLDEQHGHVKQLGMLREQADKVEMQMKRHFATSPGLAATLELPDFFEAADTNKDGVIDLDEFKAFAKSEEFKVTFDHTTGMGGLRRVGGVGVQGPRSWRTKNEDGDTTCTELASEKLIERCYAEMVQVAADQKGGDTRVGLAWLNKAVAEGESGGVNERTRIVRYEYQIRSPT